MKSAAPALGLTLIVAAVAVGVVSEPEPVRSPRSPHDFSSGTLPPAALPPRSGRSMPQPPPEISLEAWKLPPELAEAAEDRLAELSSRLALTPRQQDQVSPLVLRSTPGYPPDPEDPGQPSLAVLLGPRLTQRDLDNLLHGYLNEEQALDHAAEIAEREAWWRTVIDRLEADLEQNTAPGTTPPAATPADEGPAQPSRHRRGNLYDSIEYPMP